MILHPRPAIDRARCGEDPAARRGRARRRGVSLPVVMLSLCLIAVAAVAGITWYFGRHDVTLDNACHLLARDLRSVQNRAALHKSGMRVVFDEDGWCVFDGAGTPIGGLGENRPIARRFSQDGVFEGVRIARIELGPGGVLSIDSRGVINDGGEIELEFGQDRWRVEIERGTGQVLVHRPDEVDPDQARLLR